MHFLVLKSITPDSNSLNLMELVESSTHIELAYCIFVMDLVCFSVDLVWCYLPVGLHLMRVKHTQCYPTLYTVSASTDS